MHLRASTYTLGRQGEEKEQIRRANKFERKGGPHALNLNLWLVGQGQEGQGQELSVEGNGKADTDSSLLRGRWADWTP